LIRALGLARDKANLVVMKSDLVQATVLVLIRKHGKCASMNSARIHHIAQQNLTRHPQLLLTFQWEIVVGPGIRVLTQGQQILH